MIECLAHTLHEGLVSPVGAHQPSAEEGDLACHRHAVGAVDRARYALVQAERAARVHAGELVCVGLVPDDDGHALELLPVRQGQGLDGGVERSWKGSVVMASG